MNATNAKILLVEDDIDLGNVLKQFLAMNQFDVTLTRNGKEGLKAFGNNNYDLCILDVMMPEMDGFSLAMKIRKDNNKIPFIFLTARKLQQDKIKGLTLGADDYITKPFDPEELILRVKNILRRSGTSSPDIISIGKYILDTSSYKLTFENQEKTLTEREADLLKLLAMNKNKVLKRSEILETIWGEDDFFLGRSMDVFITRLRKYLDKDSTIQIKSIRGVGIMLEEKEI